MDGFREIPTELWLCLDDVCGRLALTALTLRSAGFPAADSANALPKPMALTLPGPSVERTQIKHAIVKHTTERTHFIIASLFTVSSP